MVVRLGLLVLAIFFSHLVFLNTLFNDGGGGGDSGCGGGGCCGGDDGDGDGYYKGGNY